MQFAALVMHLMLLLCSKKFGRSEKEQMMRKFMKHVDFREYAGVYTQKSWSKINQWVDDTFLATDGNMSKFYVGHLVFVVQLPKLFFLELGF